MQWIKCSEQPPPRDIQILTICSGEYISVREFMYEDDKGNPLFNDSSGCPVDITYWMALPEPPK